MDKTNTNQLDFFDSVQKDADKAHPKTEPNTSFSHARFAKNSYELSSHGDRRFSALNARLRDGRTIEEAYQLDVKGYRSTGNDWRLGKGKPAIDGRGHDALWIDYLALWRQWAAENPVAIEDLRVKAKGLVLTDKFASSPISQARALATILNEDVDVELFSKPKSALSFKP